MNILLFEPKAIGHHLFFLRIIAETLLGAGHRISLATDSRSASREVVAQELATVMPLCHNFDLFDEAGHPHFKSHLAAAAALSAKSSADIVFFPCFDEVSSSLCRRAAFGLMPSLALRGKIHGIFIRPRVVDHRVSSGWTQFLKRHGFTRFYRQNWIGKLFVLDETLPDSLRAGFAPATFPVLPDPWAGNFTHERSSARQRLGLPQDRFIVLHYGTASRRKGLHLLVEAANALGPDSPFFLLCAGQSGGSTDPNLLKLQSQNRALLLNRHVSNAEEEQLFCAADAVALAYIGHYGSSGVLSRAAAADRWVIASDEGLVGHRVHTHNLGLTFKSGDSESLRSALAYGTKLQPSEAATFHSGLKQYAQHHSQENFRRVLLGHYPAASNFAAQP